jgi:hypothetical protein
MARMFPKIGPQDTGSTRAEPDIYWRLAQHLSDEFTVIHSLPWLGSVAQEIDNRPVPTGEIDFLVLHQKLGILAIEVKGGVFSYDRTEFVYKRTGERIDPVRQVIRGTHTLSKWLGNSGAGRWRIGYCIIFPHSEIRGKIPVALIDRTVNPPQPIFLDIRNLQNLGEHIQEVMTYWKDSLEVWPLEKSKLDKLIDIILPSSDYTPCWQTRIKNDLGEWLKLTPEQSFCLKKIEQNNRLVATGFPGTGKTLLLLEHARKLFSEGKKVLVLTYNSLLSKRLQYELSNLDTEVLTFHEQCRRAAKINGGVIPETSDQKKYRDWCLTGGPNMLQEALNNNFLPSYDCLIVDEGQALSIDWWKILADWFNDSQIIVFCDSTQSFNFEHSTSPEEIAEAINAKTPYILTISLRSPRTIFERILEVKSADYQQFCPRPFEPDTLTEIVVEDTVKYLEQTIESLKKEGIPLKSMVIIDASNSRLSSNKLLGIDIFSASKFRGLESPVIIVWAAYGSDETSLLCAYTRATSRCIAIYDAVEIQKGTYKTFGQILLEKDKSGNIQKEVDLGLTSSIFNAQKFRVNFVADKTINLSWCSDWSGWIIQSKGFSEVAQFMWVYHLATTTNKPVYSWKEYDRKVLMYFDTVRKLDDHDGGRYCTLDFCENCEILTPFTRVSQLDISKCVVCSCEKTEIAMSMIETQREFDSTLVLKPQNSDLDKQKKRKLSIFLIALGRWNKISENHKKVFCEDILKRSGTIGYCVTHLLVLSEILEMDEKQVDVISLDELVSKYQRWCPDLKERVEEASWRKLMGHGLNGWIQKGIIRKEPKRKWIYKKTSGFE